MVQNWEVIIGNKTLYRRQIVLALSYQLTCQLLKQMQSCRQPSCNIKSFTRCIVFERIKLKQNLELEHNQSNQVLPTSQNTATLPFLVIFKFNDLEDFAFSEQLNIGDFLKY